MKEAKVFFFFFATSVTNFTNVTTYFSVKQYIQQRGKKVG